MKIENLKLSISWTKKTVIYLYLNKIKIYVLLEQWYETSQLAN